MAASTTPTKQRARKEHQCSICAEVIQIGTVYERWRCFGDYDEDTSVVKVHPDCWAFFRDQDINEWSDGDTFTEQITGWMMPEGARESIEAFEDEALRALWLAYLEEFHAEDEDPS